MQTAIKKWGNSLAIRIPNPILKSLKLEEESVLEIVLQDDKIILEKKQDIYSLCEAITEENLNIDSQWDDTSIGKEW